MTTLTTIIQFGVAALALAWLASIALRRERTALDLSWALVCGGLFMMGAEGVASGRLGAIEIVMQGLQSVTCGAFWLFSRALFRPRDPIGPGHLAVVAAIMTPSVLARLLWAADAGLWMGEARLDALVEGLFNAQLLLSSTILVLAFWEIVRDWPRHMTPGERRMRYSLAAVYAGAVGVCTVWADQAPAADRELITSTCGFLILVTASYAITHRRRRPLGERDPGSVEPEDSALARRIDGLVRSEALYLDSELRVADLAARLREPEYRISRAIAAATGSANFNQYINRFRIDHASRLLADPAHARTAILTIALDSGFASPGPFNRAFKAAHGVTPRQYRTGAMGGSAARPGAGRLAPQP